MTRFSPGSVRSRGAVLAQRYAGLPLTERVVYTSWCAAVLVTVLGLAGVLAYQSTWNSHTQSEACTVNFVSPTFSTAAGDHYRVLMTSCGRFQVPSAGQSSDSPSLAAMVTRLSSGSRYEFTFQGWGADRTLIGTMSH